MTMPNAVNRANESDEIFDIESLLEDKRVAIRDDNNTRLAAVGLKACVDCRYFRPPVRLVFGDRLVGMCDISPEGYRPIYVKVDTNPQENTGKLEVRYEKYNGISTSCPDAAELLDQMAVMPDRGYVEIPSEVTPPLINGVITVD